MVSQVGTNGHDWTEVHKLLQEQRQYMVETLGESISRQTTAIERLTKQQTLMEAEVRLALAVRSASRFSQPRAVLRQTAGFGSQFIQRENCQNSSMEASDVSMSVPGSDTAEQAESRRASVMQNLAHSAKIFHADPFSRHWWKEEFTELRRACGHCGLVLMNFCRRRRDGTPSDMRMALRKVVLCPAFDMFFGLLILCNSVLIGVETHYNATLVERGRSSGGYNEDATGRLLEYLQLVFGILFTVELLLRFGAQGCREFIWGSNWRWNYFDTLLVLTFAITFIIELAHTAKTAGATRVFRAARFCRILRTVRLVRASTYAHEFRKMAFAMQHSALTLFWALLLLFFIIYVFATTFTQVATDFVYELGEDERAGKQPDISSEDLEKLVEYWGNLPSSLYSLYAALCGGYSWTELVIPLDQVSWVLVAVFLTYIAVATFGAVNVVTSVFVESAMGSTQHFMDIKMQETLNTKRMHEAHLRDLFNEVDADGSGAISFHELERLLGDPHFMVYLDTIDRKGSDAKELFRMLDYDGSGLITKEEFCNGFLRLKGEAKSFDIHRLVLHNQEFMECLSRSCRRTYNTVLDMFAVMASIDEALHEELPEKLAGPVHEAFYRDKYSLAMTNRSGDSTPTTRQTDRVIRGIQHSRRSPRLPDVPASWASRRPAEASSRASSAPPESKDENGVTPTPVATVLELVRAPATRAGTHSSHVPLPSRRQVLRGNSQATVELHEIFEI